MSEPRQAPDELELKKRARRRLVGAVAFATFAAVVLPMVMDETPPPSARDIELRIPGQDQVSSSPLTAAKAPAASPAKTPAPAGTAADAPAANPVPASAVAAANAPAEAPPAKPAAAPMAKPAEPAKAPVPPATAARTEPAPDSGRAQAILDGQSTQAAAGPQVILIGAFANAANVKNIQNKLGQLGIKTYTEILESPEGRKTRVRAGPFANREAAEKALEKMKRIGVSGVVAPKQ